MDDEILTEMILIIHQIRAAIKDKEEIWDGVRCKAKSTHGLEIRKVSFQT